MLLDREDLRGGWDGDYETNASDSLFCRAALEGLRHVPRTDILIMHDGRRPSSSIPERPAELYPSSRPSGTADGPQPRLSGAGSRGGVALMNLDRGHFVPDGLDLRGHNYRSGLIFADAIRRAVHAMRRRLSAVLR